MGEWSSQWQYSAVGPRGEQRLFAFDRALSEAEQVYLRKCAAEGRWEEVHVLIALASA